MVQMKRLFEVPWLDPIFCSSPTIPQSSTVIMDATSQVMLSLSRQHRRGGQGQNDASHLRLVQPLFQDGGGEHHGH